MKKLEVSLLPFNRVSRNGTMYTEEAIDAALADEEIVEYLARGGLSGSINPDYPYNDVLYSTQPPDFLVSDIKKDKDNSCYKGTVTLVDSPKTKLLIEALKYNNTYGIALRGYSEDESFQQDGEVQIINDLKIIGFDIVQNPSFDQCKIFNKDMEEK